MWRINYSQVKGRLPSSIALLTLFSVGICIFSSPISATGSTEKPLPRKNAIKSTQCSFNNLTTDGECLKEQPALRERPISFYISPGVGSAWFNLKSGWNQAYGFELSIFQPNSVHEVFFGGFLDGYFREGFWQATIGPELVYELVKSQGHFPSPPVYIGLDAGYSIRNAGEGVAHGANIRGFISTFTPLLLYVRWTHIFSSGPIDTFELAVSGKTRGKRFNSLNQESS